MGYCLVHGGSADHASEERVRGLCRMLPEQPEIYCAALEEDWRYGLGAVGALTRNRPGLVRRRLGWGDRCIVLTPRAVDRLRPGVKRILWGWSPAGPVSRRQAKELAKFHQIVVTDPRSGALLRQAGLGSRVRLGPDPSFLVERQLRRLDGAFHRDTVGLCVSPAVGDFEAREGLLFHSYCHLIRWILRNTDWQIAMIPYCAKRSCNDLALHQALKRQFPGEDRLFCREDGDCRVLRGDLSLCRCCVGTAGVTAAWSCGVPGLCLGAGNRALGLADALFGSSRETVVRVGQLRQEGDLTEQFRQFLRREETLRRWQEVSVPRYRHWAAQWKWSG